jgi:hypothetical protein
MHLIVPAKLVGTIVELMDGEGILVSMNPFKGDTTKSKSYHYLGGKRLKGISGRDAVLEAVKQGHKTTERIARYLNTNYNFALKSTSPCLTHLERDGKLKRDANHNWSLV